MSVLHHPVGSILDSFPDTWLRLGVLEQRVSLQLYRLLARGKPVSPAGLALSLDLPEEKVTTLLQDWPGVYYDDERRVIGYWGLALTQMNHRLQVEERELFTWCAWDSLFIPELLQCRAQVSSTCPVTGALIRLTVSPEGAEACDPSETVMSFVKPDRARVSTDVIQHFCHVVHFFSTPDKGRQWVAEHPGTFLLSLGEAAALGRQKNASQYRDLSIHAQGVVAHGT